jgi:hypothetical protein
MSANNPISNMQGDLNDFRVYPPTETQFIGCWGWFHNHFADADSAGLIFSSGDLNILAEQVVRDSSFFKVNYKRFMIGVVADSNSYYILMVEWATVLYFNETMIDALYTAKKMTQKSLPIPKGEAESRFLTIIAGSGLKLFRGNSNGTSWNPIKLSNTGTVIENPCL